MSLKNRKNKIHRQNRAELNEACANGDFDAVKRLVDIVGNLDRVVDGCTPLTNACRWGHHEIAAFLLSRGADVNLASTEEPPLHHAIRSRDKEMVKLLLKAGANPNARCSLYGELALGLSLGMRRGEIAAELVNFGARIDLPAESCSPMDYLLSLCDSDDLLNAISQKPQWFAVTMPNGMPLLHSLAFWGASKYLKQAAADGADVNAFTDEKHRTTPLHQACINGGGNAVSVLVALGADTESVDGFGYKPFELAAELGQVDAALEIMKARASSLHGEMFGKTLHEWFADNPDALTQIDKAISESVDMDLMEQFGGAIEQELMQPSTNRSRGLML